MNSTPAYGINLGQLRHAMRQRLTRRRKCVLVVEDQRIFRQIIIEILSKDFDLLVATDGSEGIKLYELHAPDIVFLDIALPCLNGQQVLSALTAADPDCFAIMTTASHEARDIEQAMKNGAKGYIVKPYTRRKIKNYLALFNRLRAIA